MTDNEFEAQTRLTDRVAEEIRALLARRRISGRELARRLDETPSWVNYRLTGHTPINLNDLERIADALSVGITDLLPREVRTGGRSADTLHNRHVTERRRRSSENRHGSGSPERPPGRADRPHKPDTARHDTRRPRILPRPTVGTA